jgi:hypothetical protein
VHPANLTGLSTLAGLLNSSIAFAPRKAGDPTAATLRFLPQMTLQVHTHPGSLKITTLLDHISQL